MPTEAIAILFFSLPFILAAESPVLNVLKARKEKEASHQVHEQAPLPLISGPSCDEKKWEADLAFLFWAATEDGLEFAAKNRPRFPASAHIPTDISANLFSPDFTWAPAFKLRFGYHFKQPSWDLSGRWTWYYSRSSRTLSETLSSNGAGIFPLWIPPQAAAAPFPTCSNAQGSLLLHLKHADLELACTESASPLLRLKFHGGLKGIWVKQFFRAKYREGFFDGMNRMFDSNARTKNNCRGLGPRIGFGSEWLLPSGWSLIGEAAGALSLCEMITRREDDAVGVVNGVPNNIAVRLNEAFWVWRPIFEGKTGARWSRCFNKKRTLEVELAYEIQQFWEQNMLIRYADEAILYASFNNRGNLTLQGFSLTLAIGY